MSHTLGQLAHDLGRPLRLLVRHARYSRLALGPARAARIEQELETLFRAVNRMLAASGVEYWITYGTLLGWHRSRGLIAGDRDVDFGVPEASFPAVWEARRHLAPDCVMHDTSHRHAGPKLYVVRNGWEADIYFYREREGTLHSCERSRNQGDVAPFPRSHVFPLRGVEHLGERTFIPHDSEAWLHHTYGYIGEDAVKDPVTGYWHKAGPRGEDSAAP